MTKKALVRGEFHTSSIDRRGLLDRDLTDVQALYIEGRSDTIRLHKRTYSYFLYLIGYFCIELFYLTVAKIHDRFSLSGDYDIVTSARENGLDVQEEIDLEIDEIYDNFSPRAIHYSFIITAAIILISFVDAIFFDLMMGSTPIPSWALPFTITLLGPFLFLAFLINIGDDGERDEEMANSIEEITAEERHDSVLVLVGDLHVDPVSDALEKHGWEVERENSTHLIPRLTQTLLNRRKIPIRRSKA